MSWHVTCVYFVISFFFSSKIRNTLCALVIVVKTCALPICSSALCKGGSPAGPFRSLGRERPPQKSRPRARPAFLRCSRLRSKGRGGEIAGAVFPLGLPLPIDRKSVV